MTTTPALSLRNIHKSFGGIVAVEDLSLDVERGEIVALVGDNGAGKSTVVKIIAGMHQPSSGEIRLAGELVHFIDPSQSQAKGVQVVYQDLALAESQPVYMSLFLGREKTKGWFGKLDRAGMIAETDELMRELDVHIPSAQVDHSQAVRGTTTGCGNRPRDPLGHQSGSDGRANCSSWGYRNVQSGGDHHRAESAQFGDPHR